MSELTGSNHRCRAQFKCAQTVVGQRSAGNEYNGLSYDYYYYYYNNIPDYPDCNNKRNNFNFTVQYSKTKTITFEKP